MSVRVGARGKETEGIVAVDVEVVLGRDVGVVQSVRKRHQGRPRQPPAERARLHCFPRVQERLETPPCRGPELGLGALKVVVAAAVVVMVVVVAAEREGK